MKITLEDLRGGCQDQIAVFKTIFGKEAEITKENLEKAIAANLVGINWALSRIIPHSLRAEYDRGTLSLWLEYDLWRKPSLWAEYEQQIGLLFIRLIEGKPEDE